MSADVPYNSAHAWLRACAYFVGCFVIAWFFRVPQTILNEPLVTEVQLGDGRWWTATGFVTCYVLFAYAWFWPRGTEAHGRSGHAIVTRVFGVLWGAAQGQLLVAIYFAVEGLKLGDIWTAAAVISIYSIWASLWHSRYWDIYVAPPHNKPEWNTRKVLVAHVPFLIMSVLHFMTFRNAGLLVIWQIIALTSSAWAMRFPAPWHMRPHND